MRKGVARERGERGGGWWLILRYKEGGKEGVTLASGLVFGLVVAATMGVG